MSCFLNSFVIYLVSFPIKVNLAHFFLVVGVGGGFLSSILGGWEWVILVVV
jgi:hypothetical protein